MIKDNQKLLNFFRILVDTLIITGSFIAAYFLRFDSRYSFLLKLGFINEPVGYYNNIIELC